MADLPLICQNPSYLDNRNIQCIFRYLYSTLRVRITTDLHKGKARGIKLQCVYIEGHLDMKFGGRGF